MTGLALVLMGQGLQLLVPLQHRRSLRLGLALQGRLHMPQAREQRRPSQPRAREQARQPGSQHHRAARRRLRQVRNLPGTMTTSCRTTLRMTMRMARAKLRPTEGRFLLDHGVTLFLDNGNALLKADLQHKQMCFLLSECIFRQRFKMHADWRLTRAASGLLTKAVQSRAPVSTTAPLSQQKLRLNEELDDESLGQQKLGSYDSVLGGPEFRAYAALKNTTLGGRPSALVPDAPVGESAEVFHEASSGAFAFSRSRSHGQVSTEPNGADTSAEARSSNKSIAQDFYESLASAPPESFPMQDPNAAMRTTAELEERQLQLERQALIDGRLRTLGDLEKMVEANVLPEMVFRSRLETAWTEALTAAIKDEQARVERGEPAVDRAAYGPYLMMLPADVLAVITVQETMRRLLRSSLCGPLGALALDVASRCEEAVEETFRKGEGKPLASTRLLSVLEDKRVLRESQPRSVEYQAVSKRLKKTAWLAQKRAAAKAGAGAGGVATGGAVEAGAELEDLHDGLQAEDAEGILSPDGHGADASGSAGAGASGQAAATRGLRGTRRISQSEALDREAAAALVARTAINAPSASIGQVGEASALLDWPTPVKVKLGSMLLELLMRHACVHVDPVSGRTLEEELVGTEVEGQLAASALPPTAVHAIRAALGVSTWDERVQARDPHNLHSDLIQAPVPSAAELAGHSPEGVEVELKIALPGRSVIANTTGVGRRLETVPVHVRAVTEDEAVAVRASEARLRAAARSGATAEFVLAEGELLEGLGQVLPLPAGTPGPVDTTASMHGNGAAAAEGQVQAVDASEPAEGTTAATETTAAEATADGPQSAATTTATADDTGSTSATASELQEGEAAAEPSSEPQQLYGGRFVHQGRLFSLTSAYNSPEEAGRALDLARIAVMGRAAALPRGDADVLQGLLRPQDYGVGQAVSVARPLEGRGASLDAAIAVAKATPEPFLPMVSNILHSAGAQPSRLMARYGFLTDPLVGVSGLGAPQQQTAAGAGAAVSSAGQATATAQAETPVSATLLSSSALNRSSGIDSLAFEEPGREALRLNGVAASPAPGLFTESGSPWVLKRTAGGATGGVADGADGAVPTAPGVTLAPNARNGPEQLPLSSARPADIAGQSAWHTTGLHGEVPASVVDAAGPAAGFNPGLQVERSVFSAASSGKSNRMRGGETLMRKLGRSVSETAAGRVRTITTPDGRTVKVVPAFVHDYVWTAGRATDSGKREDVATLLTGQQSAAGRLGGPKDNKSVRFASFMFAHPRLVDVLSARAALVVKHALPPMVVEPRPWAAFRGKGPYLSARPPLMRTTPSHTKIVTSALEAGKMSAVLSGLDIVSSVPWKINTWLMEQVQKAWGGTAETGGRALPSGQARVPDFAPYEADDPIPANLRFDASALAARGMSEEEITTARKEHQAEVRMAYRRKAENFSLRSAFKLTLSVAEDFNGDPALYFPHNLDFRGRAYPIPPHLNHMGGDVGRALLVYSRAEPLGETGFRWLKVHLANLMGQDKKSFGDREAWVDDNISSIMQAARAPWSTGGGLWLGADKPWQALSSMREVAAVMELPAHARAAYATHLPVHQDGSCNGLQHYAALGRDSAGGRAVNLVAPQPGEPDRPADVYSRVLDLVLKRMAADRALDVPESEVKALGANPEAFRSAAKAFAKGSAEGMWQTGSASNRDTALVRKLAATLLDGFVERKVVKQTVMTSVYGVTYMGAREQIYNRLRERMLVSEPSLRQYSEQHIEKIQHACAQYLARAVLNSLGDLFSAANAIKGWLADTARAVSSAGQPVTWVTPLGLPCAQPYRREDRATVLAGALSSAIGVQGANKGDPSAPVSISRQRSAFPPNFIHSLDSSHMLMTATEAARRGITFAAVHDSFWCHPGHTDELRDVLRASFVKLYSGPVLESFAEGVAYRFPGVQLPPLPERGTLDLNEVLSAPYFFS